MCMGESLRMLAPPLSHFLGFHHTCPEVSLGLDTAGLALGLGAGPVLGECPKGREGLASNR